MQASVLVLCLLPWAVHAVPCTDSTTPEPVTPTSDVSVTTSSTAPPTTTEYVPPPKKFPQGTYGLVRPDVGCPLSTGFKAFYRYWDTEDYYNANRWPDPEHFLGYMKRDGYKMQFCMKVSANGGAAYDWPAGDYCIIKKGDCPAGFSEGSIGWDDENSFNQNKHTKKAAYQPDGSFGADTQIDFCCRSDGSASTPIKLPIRRAFYLNRYQGECQSVAEMTVTEEVVGWDDEDTSNTNSKSGAHPMDSGTATDHRLHFCYYEPAAAK